MLWKPDHLSLPHRTGHPFHKLSGGPVHPGGLTENLRNTIFRDYQTEVLKQPSVRVSIHYITGSETNLPVEA